MSRHHWMYFGCQCSSARCRRLLLERLTLLGIFSAEIIEANSPPQRTRRTRRPNPDRSESSQDCSSVSSVSSVVHISGSFPVELRPPLLPVHLQRALLADGIRTLEDPVLPGGEAAEDLRLERFGPGESQVRL